MVFPEIDVPHASAKRSRGSISRIDVRHEISAVRFRDPAHWRRLAPDHRYVPLALTILAPIIVNILLFHSLMNPSGLGLALFVTILWAVVFASVRSAFVIGNSVDVDLAGREIQGGDIVFPLKNDSFCSVVSLELQQIRKTRSIE
jgi:hypothetical protein